MGVPLLVVLLALGAPKKAQSNSGDAAKAYTTEQVEAKTIQTSVELPPAYKEDAAPPRC